MLKELVAAVLFTAVISGVAAQTQITISAADKDEIVRAHNFVRRGVTPTATNMEVMMYNEELAGIAQAYSLNCQFGHSSTVSSPSFSFIGENIFLGERVPVNYTSFIVDSWANAESPYYDFATNTCNPPPTGGACGHYTQVVWHNTDNVGCGAVRCPTVNISAGFQFRDAVLFICNFGPGGNIEGERPYESGTPCTNCPSNKPYCEANLCTQQAPTTEAPSPTTPEATTEASSPTTEATEPSSSPTPEPTTEAPSPPTIEPSPSPTPGATTEAPSPTTPEATTEAPSPTTETTTEAPSPPTTEAPSPPTTEAPSPTTTEAPSPPTTEAPSPTTTETTTEAPSPPTTETTTEAPSPPTTETTTEAPSPPTTETTTETPTMPVPTDMQPVVSFVNDSPRVEGRNILVDVQTNYSVRCAIRLAGTKSDLKNCSSASFQFMNMTPSDDRYYVMRLVVKPDDNVGMRTVLRRRIWMPTHHNMCTVHLINDGVMVNGDSATVDFSSLGPSNIFLCSLDRQALSPCSRNQTFWGLSEGMHRLKIVPDGCGKDRRSLTTWFAM